MTGICCMLQVLSVSFRGMLEATQGGRGMTSWPEVASICQCAFEHFIRFFFLQPHGLLSV